ncbi:MAG TPA: tetraacyldisaccharide 4'-kinase [Pirellulaceae bacterium]|nr:tetraacyldisaccharide 4'-kinase [Pirellulaceae bacterium]HMO90765.1 tetraacyldisaccharide 4'-kinase [Pirellulaceae bacterium]HMP68016.1 tetraacyldisaccharide 4'-kinase [Pirellulaceae bacterium]
MKRHQLEQIISGKSRGIAPAALRMTLSTLTPIYRAAISVRNFMFDRGWRKIETGGLPVISVGNLTVGGTGKTPFVAWLARTIIALHKRPAIISRGYGRGQSLHNDEYLELQIRLPHTEHLQDPNRVALARRLAEQNDADVLLLDDGFQHRRLHRDLDIVLIDCTCPFGYDRLLPRGLLREPLQALRRAHVIALTRVDQVSENQRNEIKRRVTSIFKQHGHGQAESADNRLVNLHLPIFAEVSFVPTHVTSQETHLELADIRNRKPIAFCGIGNPVGFQNLLTQLCGERSFGAANQLLVFPDHHAFNRSDVDSILQAAHQFGADIVLCTLKDYVKVSRIWPDRATSIPLGAVVVEAEFRSGETQVQQLISHLLA